MQRSPFVCKQTWERNRQRCSCVQSSRFGDRQGQLWCRQVKRGPSLDPHCHMNSMRSQPVTSSLPSSPVVASEEGSRCHAVRVRMGLKWKTLPCTPHDCITLHRPSHNFSPFDFPTPVLNGTQQKRVTQTSPNHMIVNSTGRSIPRP